MKNKIKAILITFLFIFNSCSANLLNLKEDIGRLKIRVISEELNYDKDSLKIYLSKYLNEKKVGDEILCQSIDKISSEEDFFSFLRWGSYSIDGKFNFEEGYPIQFNNDSSLALIIESDLTELQNNSSALYLVDMKNCRLKLIREFEASSTYIKESIPFTNDEVRYYTIGTPAKWLDISKFLLGTNDGIYLYDKNNIEEPSKVMEENIYSNFILYKDKLINQTITSIEVIDYAKKTKYELFDERESIGLKKTDEYLYFIKGWSLYRSDLEKLNKPVRVYKANDFIKDYLIIDDNQFIIRSGGIADIPEFNNFYYYNNQNKETVFIDNTNKLNYYYLSSDKKYFVAVKKIVQISYYDVLVVYDLDKKVKYEFDLETIEE